MDMQRNIKRKKALLMYNGKAGRGTISEDLFNGIDYLSTHNYEVTIYPIDPENHLTSESILRESDHDYEVVLVCGGDGTLNHTINGMIEKNLKTPIGYVPVGSTNDFSRSLYGDHGHGFVDICKYVVDGRTFTYDVGKFNDNYFNYVAGFGAFPMVSYTTPQELKNNLGYVAYVLKLLSTIPEGLNYKTHLKVTHDGEICEGDFMFGLITNSISVAGLQPGLIKESALDDGVFEVILIKASMNAVEIADAIGSLNGNGSHTNAILSFKMKEGMFEFDQDVPWTLDGEDGGTHQSVTMKVIPSAITVYVPEE